MTAVMFIDDWNEEKFGGIIHQYRGEQKFDWLDDIPRKMYTSKLIVG